MADVGVAVSADAVQEDRRRRLFLADGGGVLSEANAAAYVEERGFVHLFSPGNLPWPNVSAAELRARGSLETFSLAVWRWKNALPAAKRCAYGHHLRRRGVFISWRLLPAFHRLGGMHSSVDQVLQSDRLNPVERHVLQVVAIQGPIRSLDLRREVQGLSGASKQHYQAALRTLQEHFLITVAGGSVEGFTMHDWDLVERHAPPETLAATLSDDEARAQLALQAVANAPYCTAREIALLFGWERSLVATLLGELAEKGMLAMTKVEGQKDTSYRVAS